MDGVIVGVLLSVVVLVGFMGCLKILLLLFNALYSSDTSWVYISAQCTVIYVHGRKLVSAENN